MKWDEENRRTKRQGAPWTSRFEALRWLDHATERRYLEACPSLLHNVAVVLLDSGLRLGEAFELAVAGCASGTCRERPLWLASGQGRQDEERTTHSAFSGPRGPSAGRKAESSNVRIGVPRRFTRQAHTGYLSGAHAREGMPSGSSRKAPLPFSE